MKLKRCQTARLEVCYCLAAFFAEVQIFNFWPKTMDYNLYSPWFRFWSPKYRVHVDMLIGFLQTG